MRRMTPRLLGGLAIVLNSIALVSFLLWLKDTDFMFGHYKGEPERLVAALVFSVAGVAATAVWLAALILLRGNTAAPGPRYRFVRVLGSLFALVLTAPALLIIPISVSEWTEARAMMRRSAVKWNPREAADYEDLVASLDDNDAYVRAEAAKSLSEAEAASVPLSAVPRLIELASHEQDPASLYAVLMLGKLGPDAVDAIPVLAGLLGTSDLLGPVAGEALAGLGAPALPALLAGSQSENAQERASSARGLGFYTAATGETVARLVALLGDSDAGVCAAAATSLGMVGAKAHTALPELNMALTHADPQVRAAAEGAITKIAEAASDKLQQGIIKLRSPYKNNRANGAMALGAMRAEAREALPELIAAMEDPEWEVQLAAANAVWNISGDVDLILPKLLEFLQQETEHNLLRTRTMDLLSKIGPPARAAESALKPFTTSDDPGTRIQANATIVYITNPPDYLKAKE